MIRDRNHEEKRGVQNELQLAEALTRRALACSYERMDKWRKHLLAQLSLRPPPHYSRVSMEQLLRTDRAAFVRMSEVLGSLKLAKLRSHQRKQSFLLYESPCSPVQYVDPQ